MHTQFRDAGNVSPFAFMRGTVATLAIGMLVLFAACSGDNGGPEPVMPTATITHGSAALTMPQGGGGSIVFSIDRKDGHTGTVHFSVVDAPPGVVAGFSPASVSGTARLTTLSISVAILMEVGTHTLQVRVTGEGVETTTIPVTLTIVQPRIALTIDQQMATVEQQGSVSIPITVSRFDGYTGTVGLTALELPAGVTAKFEPTTLLPGETTSTLTLTASLSATTSSSPVTIRATGTGVIQTTAPFDVTVTPTTTPGVLLVPTPAFVQVRPGETAEAIIEVRRFVGYDGALNFALSAAPAGITATFTPGEDPNMVVMRVSAASDATLGARVITIRATGSGIESAESQLTARVISHPTFAFVANSAVAITQGTTATNALIVQVNRIGGFAEAIRLNVEGVPAGLTITPDMNGVEIPGTGFSGVFTYVADVDAPPGPRNFTVRGVSTLTGESTSMLVPVVVRARGSYTLALSQTSITIPRAGHRFVELTITRTGDFSGNISFSLVTTSFDVFAQFTPATTSGSSVQMRVSSAMDAMPRTYTVVLRATSPGADNVELPLTVTVTP